MELVAIASELPRRERESKSEGEGKHVSLWFVQQILRERRKGAENNISRVGQNPSLAANVPGVVVTVSLLTSPSTSSIQCSMFLEG